MNNFNVDITNCDREPIHLVGKIQSHGFLIGIHHQDQLINYISENVTSLINEDVENYLGKHIDVLEDKMNEDGSGRLSFSQVIALGSINGFDNINPFRTKLAENYYNLIVHQTGETILLEFEPGLEREDFDGQNIIGHSVSRILAESDWREMLTVAAQEIKKIIQYDRVMIYRFNDEGHGQVIAEEKNKGLQPFLGMHYPASDIPKQARELYKIKLTRIISDVDSDCPTILSSEPATRPLDLTHSVLRAVSPMHIQYLKNMGVTSSFSISLIYQGELWGLIACHHHVPRFIDYKARDAAKLISRIMSSALEYRLGEEESKIFTALHNVVNKIIENTITDNDIARALTANLNNINTICATCGAALIFDNTITSIGETPDKKQLGDIAKWVIEKSSDGLFYTNRFPSLFPAAVQYSHLASGLFACILSKELGEVILLFKPEQHQTLRWAGDPEKPVTVSNDGSFQLSPRQSFNTWTEIVRHSSEKWSRSEIAAKASLREQVIYQVHRKADEIRRLNERLKLAHEELDTFSFTVSHDLRTPLSSIKGYAELLLTTNENLDDNARKVLGRINACADKMALLIKEILQYSNFGRHEINMVNIDMRKMINDIKTELVEGFQPTKLEFIIGNTPDLFADKVMIWQVFTNLLSNAIKYSARSEYPCVKIEGKVLGNETIYTVTDNGIGIDTKYHNRVFELFRRMDNAVDFEGTGVGLAIVKRIVERHEGKIWFESELGKNTVFYIRLKNAAID